MIRQSLPLVMILLIQSGTALVGQDAGDWNSRLRSAQSAAARGNTRGAIEGYERAIVLATTPEERVQTRLALGQLLTRTARYEANSKAMLERAMTLYDQALKEASGPQTNEIQNNYAVVLLELGQKEKARQLLSDLESRTRQSAGVSKEDRASYLHNLGQALETTGEKDRAFQVYRQAIDQDVRLNVAAESAWKLALTADTAAKGITQCVELVTELLKRNDLQSAQRYLRTALLNEKWLADSRYGDLLVAALRYFNAASVGPTEFSDKWNDVFSKVQAQVPATNPARRRIEHIGTIYKGEIPATLAGGAQGFADGMSRSWAQPNDALPTLSRFAKNVGDAYFAQKNTSAAAGRYVLAFNLDETNIEAALYLANLLMENPSPANSALLDEFISRIFDAKGDAILGNDLPNIVRFHTLLGTIFEKQGRWGPPSEPRTATFQWEHALAAHRRLGGNEAVKALPGLHLKLATAYQMIGDASRAWNLYVTAAEEYASSDQLQAAREGLDRAGRVPYTPSAADRQRAAAVLSKLQR